MGRYELTQPWDKLHVWFYFTDTTLIAVLRTIKKIKTEEKKIIETRSWIYRQCWPPIHDFSKKKKMKDCQVGLITVKISGFLFEHVRINHYKRYNIYMQNCSCLRKKKNNQQKKNDFLRSRNKRRSDSSW